MAFWPKLPNLMPTKFSHYTVFALRGLNVAHRNVIHERHHFVRMLPIYEKICMVCFISSLYPYLNSGNTRIPSLAGATPLFSFLVAGCRVKCPGNKPSGLEVVQKHRWSVHSAPGCHSCVKLCSLVIISPSDIFNGQSDRQCRQAWPCREAINFGNSLS